MVSPSFWKNMLLYEVLPSTLTSRFDKNTDDVQLLRPSEERRIIASVQDPDTKGY